MAYPYPALNNHHQVFGYLVDVERPSRNWQGWIAEYSLSILHVSNDNCAHANKRIIANGYTILNDDPRPQIDTISENVASSQYGTRRQCAAAADSDIVGNMTQVVDFGIFAHDGVAECPAINGGIGTDFHVVLNDDASIMDESCAMAIHIPGKRKPVIPYNRSRFNPYSPPNDNAVSDDHTMLDDHLFTNDATSDGPVSADAG